jgi:hypothetical protein
MRREILQCLEKHGRPVAVSDEGPFFRSLLADPGVSDELKQRLQWIDAFEALCRPVENCLRLILYLSSERGSAPVNAAALTSRKSARQLVDEVTKAVRRIETTPRLLEIEPRIQAMISRYAGLKSAEELYEVVLRHHEDAQRGKPPDGKRPWFDRLPEGVAVRPQYRADDDPSESDGYVHDYRCAAVSTFLQDVGKLPE